MDELKKGIDTLVNASQNDKVDVQPKAPTPKPSIPNDKLANMNTATDIEKEVFKTPITRQNAKAVAKPNPTPKPAYKDLSDDDLYEDLADNQHWYGNAKDVNQVADTMSKRLGVSPKRALDFAKKNWKGEKTWFSVNPDELDELINHAHNTYDQEFRGNEAAEGFIKDYEFGNMDENFDPSKDYKLRDDEKAYIRKRFNELRPAQPNQTDAQKLKDFIREVDNSGELKFMSVDDVVDLLWDKKPDITYSRNDIQNAINEYMDEEENEQVARKLMNSLKIPGDEVYSILKGMNAESKKKLADWLLRTKRM